MKFSLSVASLAIAALFVSQANAATVSFGASSRPVDGGEAPAPVGGDVYQFTLSSDGDILRVGDVNVEVDAQPYNDALGVNDAPPNPAFVAVFPSLGADSFITTPGGTAVAGADSPNELSTPGASFFDTSDDGPQQDFLFAQLTFPEGAQGTFSGVVSVAGSAGPEVFPFSFIIGIPEPTSMMLIGLGLVGLGSIRRRS